MVHAATLEDGMAAIRAFGQLTPPQDDDDPFKKPLWEPLDDLEVRDRFTRKIRCLGISLKNARCRWDTDDRTLSSRVPQIQQFVTKLSYKSPHDVTDQDLWKLLDLGLCGAHGSCAYSAKEKGLGDLQTRLAATKARTISKPLVVNNVVDREITELRNTLYHKSIEVANYQSKCSTLQTQLNDKDKELESKSVCLQKEKANSQDLGSRINRLNTEIKAFEERANHFAGTCREKDSIIDNIKEDIANANQKIKKLEKSNEEKNAQFERTERTHREREGQLAQKHDEILAEKQSRYDSLFRVRKKLQDKHDKLEDEHEQLQDEHKAQTSQLEQLTEQFTLLRAEVQDRKAQETRRVSQLQELRELRQERQDQQTAIEMMKEEQTKQKSLHSDQVKKYEEIRSLNDLLSQQIQDLTTKTDTLDAEKKSLLMQLQDLTIKKPRDWWCGLNRVFCLE